MILDVASDYIELGNNIEEMQFYLDVTCASWNMAILPEREKDKMLKKYLKFLKKNSSSKSFIKAIKQDIQGIIKVKNKLYPNIYEPIIDARIEHCNGEEYKIVAVFATQHPRSPC